MVAEANANARKLATGSLMRLPRKIHKMSMIVNFNRPTLNMHVRSVLAWLQFHFFGEGA